MRRLFPRLALALLVLGSSSALLAFQQRNQFQGFGFGDDNTANPDQKDEFTFARLRYSTRYGYDGGGFGGFGFRGGGWSEDYPKGDRQFVQALTRLTRIDARPEQEVVDPDSDDLFNWPWIYAVNVQTWDFTPDEAKRMREYLLKGGFLMVDNFHGVADWESFMIGMRKVFPDRPVEDLGVKVEIFHVLYDLDQRYQVPGFQYMRTGRTYEKDGFIPEWKAIRDDDGRVMVAICHNMHLGDAWEHADDPAYPEHLASFAYRMGINYIIYPMTH